MPNSQKGWFWSYPEKFRHYYVNKTSLCGKAMLPSPNPDVEKWIIAGSKKKKGKSEELEERPSDIYLRETARDVQNNCPQCQKMVEKQFD